MACAKPTIVVGEKGLAGVVEPGRVDALAYHNFAGRNVKEALGAEDLAHAVASILDDPERTARLGTFARDYVVENYDHRVGAAKLEQVYERALADPPLSAAERRRLLRTNLRYGLGRRLEVALRLRARQLLGRART
jgi:glycosyltransferase involved in cell wall biosynthesis